MGKGTIRDREDTRGRDRPHAREDTLLTAPAAQQCCEGRSANHTCGCRGQGCPPGPVGEDTLQNELPGFLQTPGSVRLHQEGGGPGSHRSAF